ncbi:MAG: sugar phosphate isomerase/epimerase [Nitrospinae bacterium]|nr:sugar phosphate isomerase/epimerase [Nitrospinota bacterium]
MRLDYALSAHLFAYEPLRFEHLKEAAGAGFEKIELWAMTPNFDLENETRLKALKKWLADLSLTTSTFHAPFYADLSEARQGRWLSLAATDSGAREAAIQKTIQALRAFRPLGARVAVLHPSAPGKAGDPDTYDALEASIERLLPVAEETDAVLAIENIPSALGRAEPLADFVARIDHPRLRICIDTGHALITEGNKTKRAIERLAPLCAATHLHDNDGRSDAHLIPGEGAFEWPSFFTTLDARGYPGTLALELRRKDEPYAETLAAAARAMKTLTPHNKPSPA